jgi:hypothetical protein
MNDNDIADSLTNIVCTLITEAKTGHEGALRNPTPEQAEYQHKTREDLHAMVDDLSQTVYLIDGIGVFDDETIMMLHKQAYGLHDIIDGDPAGTFERRASSR